jgi:DNA-binding transcriptional regulator YhcF (GntR family)
MIELNRSGGVPLYRQLADYLRGEINAGVYRSGTRMPTENELVRYANVSRGTVKAAYALLHEEKLLRAVRGSGTYIREHTVLETQEPAERLRAFFAEAYRRGHGAANVYRMFQRELNRFYSNTRLLRAVLVDCNGETLHIIVRQLEEIPGLQVIPYLEKEILRKPQDAIPMCDFVLTTQLHFPAVVRYADRLGIPTEPLAVKESDQTIAALYKLPETQELCVIYRSGSFLESIRHSMKRLALPNPLICVQEEQLALIEDCIAKRMPLILPPDYTEYTEAMTLRLIERARKSGCPLIPFCYEVEQGSLLHLQQKIQSFQKEESHGVYSG